MQMRQSNWLSYSYTINALVYELLEVVYKMAAFSRFSEVSEEHLELLPDNYYDFYYAGSSTIIS